MAFTMEELKGLPMKIGDFLSSDVAPVALGQAAQAVMGGSPEGRQSWQSGLGGLAASLGQSNIASKAAKRQASERAQLAKLLTQALGGNINYTDEPEDGPTTSSFKISPDGKQTFSLQGRGMLGPSTRVDPSGQRQLTGGGQTTPTQNVSPPKSAGNVQPTAPPMTQSSLLPFYLAQAATGSGGGSGNLLGLTPEQIQGISRTDILGQEGANRGVGNIFSNLVKQANADYYGRLPQAKTPTAPKLPTFKLEKGGNGNLWYFDNKGVQRDTGVPYQQGMENLKTVDLGDSIGVITPQGVRKIPKGLTPQQGREAGVQDIMMEGNLGPGDINAGAAAAAGIDAKAINQAAQEKFRQDMDISELKRELFGNKEKDDRRSAPKAEMINRNLRGNSNTFVYWDESRFDQEWREIKLPIVRGRQMNIDDVKLKALEEGMTLDEALDDIYRRMMARGIVTYGAGGK